MSQEFEPEIEYIVTMTIDEVEIGSISGYSYESIAEQWRKLDHAKESYFEQLEAESREE